MNNQIQLVLKSSTTELSLNDRELGIYLTPELDGLTGLPEIRTTSGVNAGYDGGWTSAQNYDARSITIRGVIANEDVATVEQLRRQLTTLAGQGKSEELTLDLVTQAGKAYTIQVRTIALEMSLQKVLTQQEFMLQLRADDPLIYDASETGHEALLQVAQATGGFTIDFELPLAITGSSEETVVNNEGLEQVPTITRMYGALHNPKIINQTTNQFMQIEADLGFAEGDWIEPSEVVSGKDITINGAPEGAPLSSVQIDGETSQQTYSGKNLFGIPTGTINGITCTRLADGGYKLNGTASGIAKFMTDFSLTSTAHTMSYTASSAVNGVILRTRIYQADGFGAIQDGMSINSTRGSVTSSKSFGQIMIDIAKGTVLSDFIIYPQLELGSSATPFEPYVGGVPAPNPDYPQAVNTVTGRQMVKVEGKNLYRSNNQTTTWDGASVTTDGSEITFTGNSNGSSSMTYSRQGIPISIPSGTTLTVSAKTVSGKAWDSGTIRVGVKLYYSDGTNSNLWVPDYYPGAFGTTKSTTITPSKDVISMSPAGYSYSAKGITDPVTFVCQLELGNQSSAYEPYQGQSYEIDLASKNLFDVSKAQDYKWLNAGTGWIIDSSDKNIVSEYIHVEVGKTYTISGIDGLQWNLFSYAYPGAYGTREIANSTTIRTYTATAEWLRFAVGGGDAIAIKGDIQLEEGSTPTTFESFWQIELCKIGTYQDYIYKSGGKWYVHKATQKIVYNGSETWNTWNNKDSCMGFYHTDLTLAVIGAETRRNGALFCDKFSETALRGDIAVGNVEAMKQCGGAGNQYIAIGVELGRLSDTSTSANAIASFKTWLSSNTPIFYGTLATPTDTEITNQALVAQLEALAAATMYNPQTNIITLYAEGNEQPTLDVSYFTDKNPDTRDELVIDSRLRTITLNGLDVYHLQAPGSEFLMLAPGENRLALQSDITGDNGYAQVSYKQGYLSI